MTPNDRREGSTTIGISGVGLDDPFLRLLEALMPVRFEARAAEPGDEHSVRLVVVDGPRGWSLPFAGASLCTGLPSRRHTKSRIELSFAPSGRAPFPFRGRRLATHLPTRIETLSRKEGESVLASADDAVLWVVDDTRGQPQFRSALPWPQATEGCAFVELFNSLEFIDSLPIIDFLRLVSGHSARVELPLRASFVIDDPNLHWVRYGYVDYESVVRHARRVGYHMSFATIPLDTWYTHPRTAAIFRKAPDRISLLVHGNNHLKGELARPYSAWECDELLAEAHQRMQRFQLRTGIGFSPVMVPPHGACSEDVLSAMSRHGYRAACVSSGSLAYHNPGRPWRTQLGYRTHEVIGGCPVLPRWGLKSDVDNAVLLAAYLNQAIVIMGHHQDMADDLAEFDRVAGHINSLGDVRWADMRTLSELALVRTLNDQKFEHAKPYPPLRPQFGGLPILAGLRRLATEGRDRLTPLYTRLFAQ